MAGHLYIGGVEAVYGSSKLWTASADLKASLIAGTSVINDNLEWRTIADFMGSNSFVAPCFDVALPGGRTTTWDSPNDQYLLQFPAGQLNMGTPSASLPYAGMLIHEGPTTTPSSTIWAYLRFTGTTLGGPIQWGNGGVINNALIWRPTVMAQGQTAGQGTIVQLYDTAVAFWKSAAWNMAFALVRSGSFNKDWEFIADSSQTFCTNCGFGETNEIVITENDLDPQWYRSSTAQQYFPVDVLPAPLKFHGANLVQGEDAIGVLQYAKPTTGPTAANSPILGWNPITPITLNTGEDVVYGSFAQDGEVAGSSETELKVNLVQD